MTYILVMPNAPFLLKAIVTTFAVSLLSGCGYTFQGSGSILPPNIKKIYIPTVQNTTPESSITTLLTEALQDRFERFGVVTIVDNENDADAVLAVKVTKVKRGTASSTSKTDEALQQDTAVTIKGDLKSTSGKMLWYTPAMTSTKTVASDSSAVVTTSSDFASGNIQSGAIGQLNQREVARGQDQQAFTNICDDLAQRIYDDAVAPDF